MKALAGAGAVLLLGLSAVCHAAAGGAPKAAPGATPEDTAQRFYTWVLGHASAGLPTVKERGQLAEVLAPSLVQLLKDASETEARCIRVAPKGDKPDVIEGDLFVDVYEGASEVAYGEVRKADDDHATLPVQLALVDRRQPRAHPHRAVIWSDTVVLQRENARWWVRDVQFKDQRSLVGSLTEYIESGAKNCRTPP